MISATERKQDSFGAGHFGASRGGRTHKGVDLAVQVHSLRNGTVTKLGYPYHADLSFKYVEVTDEQNLKARYFYVDPCVEVGDKVLVGNALGVMQDLGKRYPSITPHIHFEVKNVDGDYLDPNDYIEGKL